MILRVIGRAFATYQCGIRLTTFCCIRYQRHDSKARKVGIHISVGLSKMLGNHPSLSTRTRPNQACCMSPRKASPRFRAVTGSNWNSTSVPRPPRSPNCREALAYVISDEVTNNTHDEVHVPVTGAIYAYPRQGFWEYVLEE